MSNPLDSKRIGFIGCGAMARALAGGLLKAGVAVDRLAGTDVAEAQCRGFSDALGIATGSKNGDLVATSDVVVLCVKPASISTVLRDLAGQAGLARPLWISIAAGIRIERLASTLPEGARIIRAMPNTPALVGAGASALCPNEGASESDRLVAEALFNAVGITWLTADETHLDAVTGLSGSGPAYVFLLLEALTEAGLRQGLPRDAAGRLATQTVFGAAKLAIEDERGPKALREQVSSPGGTTLAGLGVLAESDFPGIVAAAVEAATQRSRELSDAE